MTDRVCGSGRGDWACPFAALPPAPPPAEEVRVEIGGAVMPQALLDKLREAWLRDELPSQLHRDLEKFFGMPEVLR